MGVARVRPLVSLYVLVFVGVVALFGASPVASSVSREPAHAPTMDATDKTAIPRDTRLTTVAFVNASRGYGVFTVIGNETCSDRVGRTTNGGISFSRPVIAVSWPCSKPAPVSSLRFDDDGDGFLYGPRLFISHDNGTAWSQSRQQGEVMSIDAIGTSIWMLETTHLVASNTPADSTVSLRLLSSINGGRTWSVVPTPRAADVRPANGEGQGWLVRVSQTSAYVASSPAQRGGVPGHATPLWFTSNSGHSWSKRSIPCASFSTNVALAAAPNGTLVDACAGEPGAGNQIKETLRSTNEGRTWQVQSTCHFSAADGLRCTPGSQFSGYLGAIDAPSKNTVYLVGDRSSLMVSHNGGTTWKAVPPGLGGDAGGTSQVLFFSPTIGVVLGDNERDNELPTLWSTSDGGRHWTAREPQYN
jgi:hypothetical protein